MLGADELLPGSGPVPASPANRDYAPGFTAAMMLKDLRLAQQAAGASAAPTPLGAAAANLYQLFVDERRRRARFLRQFIASFASPTVKI